MKCQMSPSVLAASPSGSQGWTTQKARPRHSHQNNNPEVVETIYRSIIHPKANETTPCTTATETRENVSIKLPPTNYQMTCGVTITWHSSQKRMPQTAPTVQIAPGPRNTVNTTLFDGHKMLTCRYENVRVSPWWTPGSHQPRFCAQPTLVQSTNCALTRRVVPWNGWA